MELQKLDSLQNIEGRVVVVRAGLNVSLNTDGSVEDSFRIERILPTLTYLQDKGARVLVLAHIGRETEDNLSPVYSYLQEKLENFGFDPQTFYKIDEDGLDLLEKRFTELVSGVTNGEIILLDNVRQTKLESENSSKLAAIIAKHADYYVNEAFPVAHRKHMSVGALATAFPKEKRFMGKNFAKELDSIDESKNPLNPALFVISGNKVTTKLPLISNYLDSYQTVLVGGVIANTFYKYKGYEVGLSIVDDEISESQTEVIKNALNNKSLHLPEHVIVQTSEGEMAEKNIQEVESSDAIYDISPKNFNNPRYSNLSYVLWNGPLGYYEKGFTDGTNALAALIAKSNCNSVVGGGNTVSAIRSLGYEDSFTFLSTAGGAMLDYLADGELPAINALLSE